MPGSGANTAERPNRSSNFAFEIEHIHPRAGGGDQTWGNLALSCESCDLYKSDVVSALDEETGRRHPLYHPRRDRWEDHFRFDVETALLIGLTGVGRATIGRLRMNSDFQVRARRHWMQLGLYP